MTSTLFGGAAKTSVRPEAGGAPSLTDSIFGPSAATASANADLFAAPAPRPQPAAARQRKRPRTPEAGSEPGESRADALARRGRQSRDAAVDRLTLRRTDYGDGDAAREELCADVRGLLRCHGLVILRGALSEREAAALSARADATRRRTCAALAARAIPYDAPVNETATVCFRELAVRCRGRMDVRYDDAASPPVALPLLDALAAAALHGAEPPRRTYAGWIFSFPGSADQPWHQDGAPLFARGTEALPGYALNAFCGLQDARLDLGPTEFVVGSHRLAAEGALRETRAAVSAVLGRGDVLLYDYRTCHRGTSNLSGATAGTAGGDDDGGAGVVRKVLYLMYARPWFREHLNFGSESLFERERGAADPLSR